MATQTLHTKLKSNLCGIDIDTLTTSDLLDRISDFIQEGTPHQIVYVNIDSLNKSFMDHRYREIIKTSDLVYADGMGVVWASYLFGKSLPERVNLGDFLPELCGMCINKGYKLYLLGGEKNIATQAAAAMQKDFPGLEIVGCRDGFFDESENDEVIKEIQEAKPDILMVGMGVPRQEKWIRRHLKELDVPVAWGVGALFDYYSGKFPRAPVWMRKAGFEWLFRLILEPKRLWKRYLLGNFIFTLRVAFLVIIDIYIAGIAWIVAYHLRFYWNHLFWKPINQLEPYLLALPLIIITWIVICARVGLYRRRTNFTPVEETKSIFFAVIWFTISAAAISFLLKEQDLGRSVVLISGALIFVLLFASRIFFRWYENRMLLKGYGRIRTLIVGIGELAEKVCLRMEDHHQSNREIIGFVSCKDSSKGDNFAGHPIIGISNHLKSIIADREIDEVIIANPDLTHQEILNLIVGNESKNVRFNVVSDMFEILSSQVNIDEIDNFPVVTLNSGGMNRIQLGIKRIVDIVLSFIMLVPCIIIFPVIALIIKISSPGPVFFKHERVGKDGEKFTMYKFRTMHQNVDSYQEAPTNPDDERIIPIGKFLRRTSLDELPQLFNVIKGEMSLVGPRPEMPFIVDKYEKWQRRRLTVKPGITGLWQIIGRKDLPLHANLEYDFYYIQNQSLIFDLIILFKTIMVVLLGKGAY